MPIYFHVWKTDESRRTQEQVARRAPSNQAMRAIRLLAQIPTREIRGTLFLNRHDKN